MFAPVFRRKWFLLLASAGLMAAVETADYFTGPSINLSFFHFIPVLLVTYFFGLSPGLAVSFLAAGISICVDIEIYGIYNGSTLPIWKLLIRSAGFALAAIIFHLLNQNRKRLDALNGELNAANERLRFFTSMASHDLKAPLSVINMYADLLKETPRDSAGEAEKYIDNISQTSGRMMKLVEDLQEYSRASQKDLRFEKVDLNILFSGLLMDLDALVRAKGALVVVGSMPEVEGNPALIRQLFQNLITNALKYCERPPEIRIKSNILDGKAQVRVSDNGIGFEESRREELFAPFKRLHSGYEGTGMGLAICSKIVEQHRGAISAESKPNEGSVFTVTLPLKR